MSEEGLALLRALREEPSVSVELAGKALGIGRSSAYSDQTDGSRKPDEHLP